KEALRPDENHVPDRLKAAAIALLKKSGNFQIRSALMDALFAGNASIAEVFVGTADPEEIRRLDEGRKSDNPDLQRNCMRALKSTPDRKVADEVLAIFRSGEKSNRGEMALVLGGKDEERYGRALTREMQKADLWEALQGNVFTGMLSWTYRRLVYGGTL